MHNPNPFDFVPFSDRPILRTPEEFDALGAKVSGYLVVRLNALTPLHLVGALTNTGAESRSWMHKQGGDFCVPASSIRGCLRSFVEALTSGWVSQVTEEYLKEYRKRHLSFRTFEETPPKRASGGRSAPPAVDPLFRPRVAADGRIDVASYLFGIVVEPEQADDPERQVLARKGRVWVEDAFIDKQDVVQSKYWLPGIDSNAFMGGAKPSASNWWYLQPDEIWKRLTAGREVAEFIGSRYWGRKFYFHQDPTRCVSYYDPDAGQWNYDDRRPFRRVWLESMETEKSTRDFRIYLDEVPRPLVDLLGQVLLPGSNIRHKLGYGKAYGYGSIEFSVIDARLRVANQTGRVPSMLQTSPFGSVNWDADSLRATNVDALIDRNALEHLARILGWQDQGQLMFTYPPFTRGYFGRPVQFPDLKRLAPKTITVGDRMSVTPGQAWAIAAAVREKKMPIHFRYYQEQAAGWDIIARRTP